MNRKSLVQFQLNGSPVLVEVEELDTGRRVSLKPEGIEQAQMSFIEALEKIRPAADTVLKVFREMNSPKEIELEFGVKLSGSAGAIFTSVTGEATFKVTLKWQN